MIKEYEEKKADELKRAQEHAKEIQEENVMGEVELPNTPEEANTEKDTTATEGMCDNR